MKRVSYIILIIGLVCVGGVVILDVLPMTLQKATMVWDTMAEIFAGFVILGLMFEESHKKSWEQAGRKIVIIALAAELICLIHVNIFTGKLFSLYNATAANAIMSSSGGL